MQNEHRMELFACRASRDFALKVVDEMNRMRDPSDPEIHLGESEVTSFSDGEFQPSFIESVRGATCFILQSTFPPADNLMELLLTIDAAKRASADKVIAVIPYFGWARQDRKDKPRVSIGAKLAANLLKAAGTDGLMACDLHADQIQGFFDIPVNHLYASNDFLGILKKLQRQFKDTLSIAAPDMGGAKRANVYARNLRCPVVICHKTRARANVVDKIVPIGDVEGRDIVIVDDIIDTAGTLTQAANELVKRGARSVRAFATHPVLSGPAYERIDASALSEVYVTDTIPLSTDPEKVKYQGKFRVVSLANTFAKMILRVYNYLPISPEFII
jgi:ribose-phosphate pyrophosphokinase